jgi:2-hydroxy-6-oxonona-2,4-dienedioate hydrolase
MGKNDNLIPSIHIDKFKDILEDAELFVVEDAGHSPFFEKPTIVYEKLRIFLTE